MHRDQVYINQLERANGELQDQIDDLSSQISRQRVRERHEKDRLDKMVRELSQRVESKEAECVQLRRHMNRLTKRKVQELKLSSKGREELCSLVHEIGRPICSKTRHAQEETIVHDSVHESADADADDGMHDHGERMGSAIWKARYIELKRRHDNMNASNPYSETAHDSDRGMAFLDSDISIHVSGSNSIVFMLAHSNRNCLT
jgi:chromosome segregation ATPase